MKIRKIGLLILVIINMFALSGCILDALYITNQVNGVYFMYSDVLKPNYASAFDWDGSKEHMIINIPDKVNGFKITQLGNRLDCFCINLPKEYGNCSYREDMITSNYKVQNLYFTLNLGKNISDLAVVEYKGYHAQYDSDNEFASEVDYEAYMQSLLFTKIVVYVNCDKDNKTFYSKDGKLYYRCNNTLVDKFFYD